MPGGGGNQDAFCRLNWQGNHVGGRVNGTIRKVHGDVNKDFNGLRLIIEPPDLVYEILRRDQ